MTRQEFLPLPAQAAPETVTQALRSTCAGRPPLARQEPPTSTRADLTCGRPAGGTSTTQAGERPRSAAIRERHWSSGPATGAWANVARSAPSQITRGNRPSSSR